MPRQNGRWSLLTISGGLAVLLAASGWHLARCRSEAYVAVQNRESCRQLADQIEALKVAPALASLEQRPAQDLTRKVEQTLQLAEIPNAALVSVSPQANRKLTGTAFQAHPTSVQIREVTLKQLVRFLVEISAAESGLCVTALHLTAPRTAVPTNSEERWSVELTLTYLVFSPEYAPAHSGDSKKSHSDRSSIE